MRPTSPVPRSRGRSRVLIVLQIEATLLMSAAIGQAGLAAGFLTGQGQLKEVHRINAWVIVVLTGAALFTARVYARGGGPRWPALLAGTLAVVEGLQILLVRFDQAGPHIFLGVLFVVAATLFTSYLFRPGFLPPGRG